ncbi:MAG: hypothetical protein M1831_000565 [Alyxoria varia]|nr:MAG: hypothetical protein M1831_000565 [Alyxoria varia]
MPSIVTLAVAQTRTANTLHSTLSNLETLTRRAASRNVDILLFPEAYLGGYPRACSFGCSVGSRLPEGREQFLHYFKSAADLGDTPEGADEAWISRRLPVAEGSEHRGDSTRETLERIARETDVFLAVGVIERAGGSLYCSVLYVCPSRGCIGKRRKVMPTGSERLIWAQGSPRTLRAVTATIRGVKITMAAAICWENYMPLLRQSLYAQNVNLWLAPTADAREAWGSLLQTVGVEGRCFVLGANQCVRQSDLPEWIQGSERAGSGRIAGEDDGAVESLAPNQTNGNADAGSAVVDEEQTITHAGSVSSSKPARRVSKTAEGHEINWPVSPVSKPGTHARALHDYSPAYQLTSSTTTSHEDPFVSRGGSLIASPYGDVLAGPSWETPKDELLIQTVDFEDCDRGRLDLDVAGSYSRNDSFKLEVAGLDLSPPP